MCKISGILFENSPFRCAFLSESVAKCERFLFIFSFSAPVLFKKCCITNNLSLAIPFISIEMAQGSCFAKPFMNPITLLFKCSFF